MANPVTTDVEHQLNAMMSRYGTAATTQALQNRLHMFVSQQQAQGIAFEVIAFCVAQHASACVAALKMNKLIPPELADLLARDFTETLHRANPGAPQLSSKQ